MVTGAEPTGGARARWIGAGYAAQGLGYAAVVTALPMFKERQGFDDALVSAILLLVVVAAAGGSLVADAVAARWGSRFALAGGLLTVGVALGADHVPHAHGRVRRGPHGVRRGPRHGRRLARACRASWSRPGWAAA